MGNLTATFISETGVPSMAFEVPPLAYPYDALEPHIDEQTMRIHHDKHHDAYVGKLNDAIAGTDLANMSIETILQDLGSVPEAKRTAVQNQGGGHANHALFWTVIGPNGGGTPSGSLSIAIDSAFGSFDGFKASFTDAATTRFGSGWAWLVVQGSSLAVCSTANQDTPLSQGDTPILGIDVWEHAYYLNYQNRRPDYIEAFYNVIDWAAVGDRYERAIN